MTEYTRQMHDKIMKIYRRENAKLNLWLLTGFLPPILTLKSIHSLNSLTQERMIENERIH